MRKNGLVLASESPRRLALLQQAGIAPDAVQPAGVDETPQAGELPRVYARRMAIEKAERVLKSQVFETAMVLAADTVVCCGRRILPKAVDNQDVGDCLQMLSGRRHSVFTAVVIARKGVALRCRVVCTRVSFRRLNCEEIDAYVRCGEGKGKAGGYAIQGRAESFVRSLSGSYSNVVGLPLSETILLLRGCGFAVPC